MTKISLPVGIASFSKIREDNYYYIDKTGLIRELLKTNPNEVTLITRPRRFGKTLNMNMLAEFFDIRKDSAALFTGLEVAEDKMLCDRWMNQYPTVYFTFKNVEGLDFSSACGMLMEAVVRLYKEHYYLLDSGKVNDLDKEKFIRVARGEVSDTELKNSLLTLMLMLREYYNKPVILLIDEYDVPLAKASERQYYEQMLDMIRGLLGQALKDNPALRFAVVTGCLRIAKGSIFTGTNNFVSDTISDYRFAKYFGFTEEEVKKLLADTGLSAGLEQMRRWYDGYRFGDVEIYCPWDVLNYVAKLSENEKARPESFWENTSDNSIIRSFMGRTDLGVQDKFEKLLEGDCIKTELVENLTYDTLHSSEENLWSLLYLTGYLTTAYPKAEEEDRGMAVLRIPNEEIMLIFRKMAVEWFQEQSQQNDRRELFAAAWKGQDKELTEMLSDILFDTISYHDYQESFYHAFLAGLFSGAGYIVESNYEHGLGRSDVVIKDRKHRRAILFEAKHAADGTMLERDCDSALSQIMEKQYDRGLEREGYRSVICYGIAFYKKECLVKKAY